MVEPGVVTAACQKQVMLPWHFREKINIHSIKKVHAFNKKLGVSDRQVVKIQTDDAIYEFFLWLRDKSSEEHLAHVLAIKTGIDSIIMNSQKTRT